MPAVRNDWRANDGPCPLCGSARRRVIGRRGGDAHRARRGVETRVVRCCDCGGYYASPTLLPNGNPYADESSDDYFRLHDAEQRRGIGRRLAATAEALLGRKGTMLELGCGRGDVLRGARDAGWSVCGIEMTPQFADEAEARGIEVERSDIESARLLDRQFDAIMFAAVLEHLYRPMEVLRRARRALTDDGVIFIDVPNEDSLALAAGNLYMRARGRDWAVNLSPTFPPYHVVGFTPASLRRALEASGFDVIELTTVRWGTELPQLHRMERAALRAVSWLGSKLGRADGICCWARAA